MLWVKRNIIFVILCAIGVILIAGCMVFYFNKHSEAQDMSQMLEERTARLKEMYDLPIFPSAENLRAIEEDHRRLNNFIEQCKKYFQPVPPLNVANVQALKTALDTNIYKFHQEAKKAGVIVAVNNYGFSFDELIKRIDFSPFSIKPIAQQLSEVDKILEILYSAKINKLEFIQRARICPEDRQPNVAAAHYLTDGPITNSLLYIHPYRITFSCFSSELEAVMQGFLRSPYGFVIKAIDVEPATPGGGPSIPGTPPGGQPPSFPPSVTPTPFPQPPRVFPQPGVRPFQPGAGGFPRGGRQPGGNVPRRVNLNQPPSYAAPPPGIAAATGASGMRTNRPGVITLFNERPFRVSMLVYVVYFK